MGMWFAFWVAFVLLFVVLPLVMAGWRDRRIVNATDTLPEPRARQRPAPDVVEAQNLTTGRLRFLAGASSLLALVWLVVGLIR